ncbi:hypothetical protein V8C43DRAFT_57692 [Trichoderma afarasin]
MAHSTGWNGPRKTQDCTLILLPVFVLVRRFPMDTQSYGLFHFYFLCSETRSRSDEWLLLSFLFGYSKDRFLLRATCTTTKAHGEETPRHGAFFHLEIPSVIISGASQASGRRRGGRSKKTKATARWRGCLFYMTFID